MSRITLLLLVLLAAVRASFAQNIDMSTVPARDSVQLTIYNGLDLTLVRESRHVTLRKGNNQLQFSWANTLIDPSSLEMELPRDVKGVDIIDTRFPHERHQTLYWTVRADRDMDVEVHIRYFTSGIAWACDYVATVDASEREMALDGFVTITNNSGEDYENANVRMVVGTINLVEAVAELARRQLGAPLSDSKPGSANRPASPEPMADLNGEAGERRVLSDLLSAVAPKEIVKEGLSEYFIFTVPGEETVRNGWSKRMRLFAPDEGKKVPFRIEYRYRPQEYGEELVRMFLVRNDTASTLGNVALARRRGAALPAHRRRRPERPGVPPDEVRPRSARSSSSTWDATRR
jgi:hypothetical protein